MRERLPDRQINNHRDREADRHKDGETSSQTDRQRKSQSERERDTGRDTQRETEISFLFRVLRNALCVTANGTVIIYKPQL